jgi:hypothetical protein
MLSKILNSWVRLVTHPSYVESLPSPIVRAYRMNSPFGNRSTSPCLPPSRREHESEQLLAPLREEYDVRMVIAFEVENDSDSEIDKTRSPSGAGGTQTHFRNLPARPFRRARQDSGICSRVSSRSGNGDNRRTLNLEPSDFVL